MALLGSISIYENEVDLVVESRIYFSTLGGRYGASYWSPPFSFGGEEWCLGIYPNGRSRSDSSEFVHLWFWKYPSGRSITQSFSLSLKTVKGEKFKEEHYTRDFNDDNRSYEFIKFISRSELTRRSSDLLPDDVLTFVCTMKGPTSAECDSNYASAEICAPVSDSAGCSSDSGECRHCRRNFAAGSLSSHQRKCMQRPVKCPDCLKIVELQKWFDEHHCQHERPEGVACALGSSTNFLEKTVLRDFKKLFLNKEDCDVTIKVEGSEFPVHRLILKARSPVFASTFRDNMKENATGVLEIEDCDPSTFSDFLCYLYCADAGIISQENVFGLFTAADKYQILDLRVKCFEFIYNNLTVDTFCETLTLALKHSETELIKLSTDFFTRNAPKIVVTVKWQTFLAENPTASNELLVKLLIPGSSCSK